MVCFILTNLHTHLAEYLCIYVYICPWIPRDGKCILFKDLPESYPVWCSHRYPRVQSVPSFGWGMRSCGCFPFIGPLIFWSPSSLTNLGETNACPGSWDPAEDCLTVHKYLMLFVWEDNSTLFVELDHGQWLAVSNNSRKHDCYFSYRFPSQSMVVSFCLCTHAINVVEKRWTKGKRPNEELR